MLLVFRQHRLASSATGGASVMLPACFNWIIKHCGAVIISLIIKAGWVTHFILQEFKSVVCFHQFKFAMVFYRHTHSGQPQGLSLQGAEIRKITAQNQSVLCRNPSVSASPSQLPLHKGAIIKFYIAIKFAFVVGFYKPFSPHHIKRTAIKL